MIFSASSFRSSSRCSSSGWWRRASPTWDATPAPAGPHGGAGLCLHPFLGLRHLPHGAGAVPRIARRRRSRAARRGRNGPRTLFHGWDATPVRCHVGAGTGLRTRAGDGLYAQRETQRGDGRFQVDHRPRDRGRHHPAAALLYLRNLPFDDPVRAGGRGAGRLREADRGDLLHDRRAAARTVLHCRGSLPAKTRCGCSVRCLRPMSRRSARNRRPPPSP